MVSSTPELPTFQQFMLHHVPTLLNIFLRINFKLSQFLLSFVLSNNIPEMMDLMCKLYFFQISLQFIYDFLFLKIHSFIYFY